MLNNKQMYRDIDEPWEVRAFEEDTSGNLMGCTWPPRSYACTFCQREFRSAQALGGHMNVHRRDRARLHEIPRIPPTKAPSSTLLVPTQEFIANGLCLFYSFPNPNPNPNGFLIPTINPYSLAVAQSVGASVCHSSNTNDENVIKDLAVEELDLELRLGRRPPQP